MEAAGLAVADRICASLGESPDGGAVRPRQQWRRRVRHRSPAPGEGLAGPGRAAGRPRPAEGRRGGQRRALDRPGRTRFGGLGRGRGARRRCDFRRRAGPRRGRGGARRDRGDRRTAMRSRRRAERGRRQYRRNPGDRTEGFDDGHLFSQETGPSPCSWTVFDGRRVMSPISGSPTPSWTKSVPAAFANGPGLWAGALRWPRPGDHKYSRGHAVIAGGGEMTGAAKLAARAAMRIGAGMTSVLCPPEARAIYAAGLIGPLVVEAEGPEVFAEYLGDPRRTASLVGPGAGVSGQTRGNSRSAPSPPASRPCSTPTP